MIKLTAEPAAATRPHLQPNAIGVDAVAVDHSMTPNADRYNVNRRLSVRMTPPEERLERAIRADKARLLKEQLLLANKLPKLTEDADNDENVAPLPRKAVTRLSVIGGRQPLAKANGNVGAAVGTRRSSRLVKSHTTVTATAPVTRNICL